MNRINNYITIAGE